jgi:hypothetical protein
MIINCGSSCAASRVMFPLSARAHVLMANERDHRPFDRLPPPLVNVRNAFD